MATGIALLVELGGIALGDAFRKCIASRVRRSPTPRPRAPESTTTSSIQARVAVGMRNTTRVSVPMISPPLEVSRANKTEVDGAAMIFSQGRLVQRRG